ncbi:MAG: sensor histidine kinase, partial [Nitrososphaeraceae archaeon]
QLTDNILDVTKIESHSFKLNKEQFNIEQLIEEVAEEQNTTISDKIFTNTGIKILLRASNKEIEGITDIGAATKVVPAGQVKSSSITSSKRSEYKISVNKNAEKKASGNANGVLEPFMIEADKSKVSQVLSNLLSNALSSIRLKNGTEEGRITITVGRREKMTWENKIGVANKSHDLGSSSESNYEIIINVTDNGQGIPPDVAQNLFTKFVSGSDSGTGLGLYISKNIIEAHGGRIWAKNNDSTAPIEGTVPITSSGATFSFSLPALEIITKSK